MNLRKEIGKAFFVGILIFIVMGVVRYMNGDLVTDGKELLTLFLLNQLYSVVIYMGNALLIFYLIRKYKSALFQIRHLAKAIFGAVIISLLCIFLLRVFVKVVVYGSDLMEMLRGEKLEFYYSSLIIAMVVTCIFYLFYYYRHKQETKVKQQKIIAGAASAQFDALKNQLDPHFLFNSLNVLTSLIEENPEAATRFTTALSKVYRYVLEQKNKQLVTISEELNFAKLYMSLIKMRFEDSIVFSAPEHLSNPEAMVVPLSLQLLLENAVKHNQVTPSRKLYITISEKEGSLVIQNNYQPKKVVRKGTGVGLQNIRNRYQLLTNRTVVIQQNEKEFSVAIPLLTKALTPATQTQETYLSGKRYDRAKKKVEELKGFYVHFAIYLIMVPVFIYLNLKSTGFPWALFPIIGWGAGVSGHAMEVFSYNPILGKNWEERKIRELMDKDNK
ncbi:MAG: 2TM domain-containing protein [Bacteroidota bacterium]